MSLFHGRWRRRVSLLAARALDGAEREATLRHLEGCETCRTERRELEATLALLGADPAREAEPAIPFGALLTRVQARIDERERRVARTPATFFRRRPLAAAAVVAVALVALLRAPQPVLAPAAADVSEAMLRRMEGTAAREQAVRYLNEAQDVLVTMSASARDCDRGDGRVDVGAEAHKSRELLARRALVAMDRVEVASARPVLDDVERVLREVAALESCARAGEVAAIHQQLEERRLLMKIDLMTRELQG
jgi:hypothetical protein